MDHPDDPGSQLDAEQPPPIGGSWRALYLFVLLVLALLIAVFYGFTAAFA
jgi:hypothetical protein